MLKGAAELAFKAIGQAIDEEQPSLRTEQVGTILSTGDGIARVSGLFNVKSGEVLSLEGGALALAYDLDPDEIGAVLFDIDSSLRAGGRVYATGNVVTTPVGEGLLGRVVDPLGRVLDNGPPLRPSGHYPIEREAIPIVDRAPVSVPLQTGVKSVDAFVPVGRGQRELILGDRQTGKTSLALDAVINQVDTGVLCVYASIGQSTSATAQVIQTLRAAGALDYTIVVVASGDDAPGLQYIAPYAATSMAEYLMEQGRDVLIIYDDLTKHAYAYRELSLLLRRPPGREAFPSDIFYAQSRLLERSTRLVSRRGGGSMTALPIAETQAQNISAYVPTNLISITDGQVYLDSTLFQMNIRPAVDVGRSVSRVGGKSQLPAFRRVVANLKLAYSQFEELELFSRLGTRLDEASERAIRRGREIREIFKQGPFEPVPVGEQVGLLVALTGDVFTNIPLERVGRAVDLVRERHRQDAETVLEQITQGEELAPEDQAHLVEVARRAVAPLEVQADA